MNAKKKAPRILFYIGFIILIYLLLELFAFACYYLFANKIISSSKKFLEQKAFTQKTDFEVIHPYLGSVCNPEANAPSLTEFHGKPISQYGFIDDKDPVFHKSDKEIIIGIFGGSFAHWFSVYGADSLIRMIKRSPSLRDKDIVIVRTALFGYKQPQQLMALTYLLGLGAKFDIVINLDGFNDIILPITDNIPKQIFPFYPRNWLKLINELPDSSSRILVGEIAYLQGRRERLVTLLNSRLRYSFLVKLVGEAYNIKLLCAIYNKELDLLNLNTQAKTRDYILTGPSITYSNEQDMYNSLAYIWYTCSLQMHRLCKANHIQYYHFLQPNQYVPGTRKLSGEEKRVAYCERSPYRVLVNEGYPYLRREGIELNNQGVNFHDLTPIFNECRDTVYVDGCCHISEAANAILGAKIGEIILKAQGPGKKN